MTPLRRINQALALGMLGWDYILGLNLAIAGGLAKAALWRAWWQHDPR